MSQKGNRHVYQTPADLLLALQEDDADDDDDNDDDTNDDDVSTGF